MQSVRNREKIKRRIKKNGICLMVSVIATLVIAGSQNGGENAEPANAPEAIESPEAVFEPAKQEILTTKPETLQEAKTEPEEAKPESDNPLMNAEIQIGDVLNGTRSEKLGEWAGIHISKESLKEITQEQFSEFCNDIVKDSGYNWFTISCDDGTGIQFAGSISYAATYGNLDNEGCIAESIGTIVVQEDGRYSYTETE